jgi:hypothetical protein
MESEERLYTNALPLFHGTVGVEMKQPPFAFNLPICKACIREWANQQFFDIKTMRYLGFYSQEQFELYFDLWFDTINQNVMPCPYQNLGRKVWKKLILADMKHKVPKNVRQVKLPKNCQYPMEQLVNQEESYATSTPSLQEVF